ncbi:extracellular solute-binding protein [Neoaquamicrobium sediminum]|uniref:extracellular solute-binding protein n=1 Tax=Neoaquamicrobium sediminum TaxID=1849104 RepID=UPI001562F9D1|nr:extracellular solute-binding protein [Mesorhizobium sediminum]NRC56893.1 extracellular solute-binding protein [Mesorhizobium sediminum]
MPKLLKAKCIAGVSFLALATGIGPAASEELLIATWGGGVEAVWEEAFAKPFKEETGLDVRIVPVPTPEAQLRTQAGDPQYHAVMVTYPQGANLLKDGMIELFDPADIPTAAETNPDYLMRSEDGKLAGVSPYFMYYGIAVNTDLAKPEEFSSWSNPATRNGVIFWRSRARSICHPMICRSWPRRWVATSATRSRASNC